MTKTNSMMMEKQIKLGITNKRALTHTHIHTPTHFHSGIFTMIVDMEIYTHMRQKTIG